MGFTDKPRKGERTGDQEWHYGQNAQTEMSCKICNNNRTTNSSGVCSMCSENIDAKLDSGIDVESTT